jgi:hypothetical protein
MKIKLDKNIGRRGVELLQMAGHDVSTVREQNLQGANDETLFKACADEGRQIARAKGVKMGHKPKLTAHQMQEARQRLAKGEKTRDLAKSYGVGISTISRLAA